MTMTRKLAATLIVGFLFFITGCDKCGDLECTSFGIELRLAVVSSQSGENLISTGSIAQEDVQITGLNGTIASSGIDLQRGEIILNNGAPSDTELQYLIVIDSKEVRITWQFETFKSGCCVGSRTTQVLVQGTDFELDEDPNFIVLYV